MRFRVYWTDMRGGYVSSVTFRDHVIDEETGKIVGFVESTRSPASRRISLFDGKYRGEFTRPEECSAFAMGVAAVLNHMTELAPATAEQAA